MSGAQKKRKAWPYYEQHGRTAGAASSFRLSSSYWNANARRWKTAKYSVSQAQSSYFHQYPSINASPTPTLRLVCRLSWRLKYPIKLTNGAGALLVLIPHASNCRNHGIVARRSLAVTRLRVAWLIIHAKLSPKTIFVLPMYTLIFKNASWLVLWSYPSWPQGGLAE